MLRSRRNVFALGQKVVRATEPATELTTVRLQHVKFKRRFRPWQIAGTGIAMYGCYSIYSKLVMGKLDDFLKDELASMTPEERKELVKKSDKTGHGAEEGADDIISIPLPFTTRAVKQPPYAGNSPEWKAFVALSRDTKLRAKMENDVCNVVQRLLQNSPVITMRLGKDLRVSRKMLSFNYPPRPPPVYMRMCFVVDDDAITVAERPIHPWVQTKIMHALWPSALAMSLWTFSGALLQQNMDAAARLLGLESSGQSNITLSVDQVDRKLKEIVSNNKAFSSPNLPTTPDSKSETSASGSSPPGNPDTTTSREKTTEPTTNAVDRPLPSDPSTLSDKVLSARDLHVIKMTQEHTSGPWSKFKHSLVTRWKTRQICLPSPGSVAITGLISYEAPHAYVTCEVMIWYNAVSKQYEMRSSQVRVKEIMPKRQSPLPR